MWALLSESKIHVILLSISNSVFLEILIKLTLRTKRTSENNINIYKCALKIVELFIYFMLYILLLLSIFYVRVFFFSVWLSVYSSCFIIFLLPFVLLIGLCFCVIAFFFLPSYWLFSQLVPLSYLSFQPCSCFQVEARFLCAW